MDDPFNRQQLTTADISLFGREGDPLSYGNREAQRAQIGWSAPLSSSGWGI